MDTWLQEKYILLLSNRLEKFKRKSPNLFNFRCFLCGDSEKNPNKARAYFYKYGSDFKFSCKNCNRGGSFESRLKQLDPTLYYEMKKESLGPRLFLEPDIMEEFIPKGDKTCLEQLKKISDLNSDHSARKYLEKRLIPKHKLLELYYCEDFRKFVNSLIPGKLTSDRHATPRIIIPFFDQNKELFGFQGRALDPKDDIRYISIILDESKPKAYGLDSIDFNKKYYIFEGPFDSMFINNSIAACGSDVLSVLTSIGCNKSNAVIVFDNEPRNKDITGSMENAINLGWNICIWPDYWEHKDINDGIKAKIAARSIQYIIDDHTYNGITAKLKLSSWRKNER